jgi:chemotaxis protein histidine kinase CheA
MMSVNFNVAMLRSLQQPIEESLEASMTQVSQYLAGALTSDSFDAASHMHLVRGSLAVIGCQAAARIAGSIEDAFLGIARPDRRGWDAAKTRAVAAAAGELTNGLLQHLRHILVDDEDLPVRLWPSWRTLSVAMEVPPGSPEELFEPDPDFEDIRFAPLAEDYLKEVSDGMADRLENALSALSASTASPEVAEALRDALKVFDWAYGLRHGRGYQAYWLALRARLSIGLLNEPASTEDRAEWNVLLKEALIEVRKYSQNNRRVHPELLMKTLRPMLIRWPSHWVASHPTLAEADRRLGFGLFWDTVTEVESPSTNQAISRFAANQDDLLAMVAQVKQDWGKYVIGEGVDPAGALEKALQLLNTRRPMFSDPALLALLDVVIEVASELPAPARVPDELAIEFASSILLVEEAVERRGRLSAMSDSQSSLQRRRLRAAHKGEISGLQKMAEIRWDAKKQERQLRIAHSAIFTEIRADIQYIEDVLAERLREEHSPVDMARVRSNASLASAVLRLLAAPFAAEVTSGLVGLIEDEDSNQRPPEVMSALTLGVAGLSAYLAAREGGDEEANHLLEAAYRAVVGKPMPSGVLSEDAWKKSQRLIEEANAAALDEEAADQDAKQELSAAPAPPSIPYVSRPPAFDPVSLFAAEGYTERRKGVEIEAFFLEEMEQVLGEIAIQRAILASTPADPEARTALRRQFHTIKGSGRLAGFHGLGDIAYQLERRLDSDMEESSAYLPALDQAIALAAAEFSLWFGQLRAGQPALLHGDSMLSWLEMSRSPVAEEAAETAPAVVEPAVVEPAVVEPAVVEPAVVEPAVVEYEEPVVVVEFPASSDIYSPTEQSPEMAVVESASGNETEDHEHDGVAVPSAEPFISTQPALTDHESFTPWPPLQIDAAKVSDDAVSIMDSLDDIDVDQANHTPGERSDSETASDDVFAAPADDFAYPPGPMPVSIIGFGLLDQESYGLLVEDLLKHQEVLAQAANTMAGEVIDIEPVHRAAHTAGSLGATIGLSSLAVMGRGLERYLARFGDEHEVVSRQVAWTQEGQDGSEALWMMIASLVDKQQLLDADTTMLSVLSNAPAPPSSRERSYSFSDAVVEPSVQEHTSEAAPVETSSYGSPVEMSEAPAEHAPEQLDVAAPPVDQPIEGIEYLAPSSSVDEALPSVVIGLDGSEESLPSIHVLQEAPSSLVLDDRHDLATPEAIAPAAPVEDEVGEAVEAVDDEDEALWDEVFESFALISSELRRIGPLLAALNERRR